MKLRSFVAFCTLCIASATMLFAQQPTPKDIASTIMKQWPNGSGGAKWTYDEGTMLDGMDGIWFDTADRTYYQYIQHSMDRFLSGDGSVIQGYNQQAYTLDNILLGRQLLLLYNVTRKPQYYTAATQLYDQLQHQPRTSEGGFWHKKNYEHQMWLDGLYMAEPFYAEYAAEFHHEADLNDVVKQFVLMEQHTRDPKTGLLYHGWDESKQQRWASRRTGASPTFWSRSMGWYGMALVDTLPYIPESNPGHAQLVEILNRLAKALVKYQDPKTGVWYQVTDKRGAKGNYAESSGSAMFVYMLAKGVRLGYLPTTYLKAVQLGYEGIGKQFVSWSSDGTITLKDTADSVGLGGTPYRDGSYKYYSSVKRISNDPRGMGALLLAGNEVAKIPSLKLGLGKTVLLDSYYDSESRKDITGQRVSFHYKWEEHDNDGYFFFGHTFRSFGAKTSTLYTAPTAENLAGARVYIIVNPNFDSTPANPHYNPHPNFVQPEQAEAIADWVHKGGVLLIFNNDAENGEFDHLNILGDKFGIHFNKDRTSHVVGVDHEMGRINLSSADPIFRTAHSIFIKDMCTLTVKSPAEAIESNKDGVLMAVASYGKGKVFAVGDPWFYNEYTDGRKLTLDYQNLQAAKDMARWALTQASLK